MFIESKKGSRTKSRRHLLTAAKSLFKADMMIKGINKGLTND